MHLCVGREQSPQAVFLTVLLSRIIQKLSNVAENLVVSTVTTGWYLGISSDYSTNNSKQINNATRVINLYEFQAKLCIFIVRKITVLQ